MFDQENDDEDAYEAMEQHAAGHDHRHKHHQKQNHFLPVAKSLFAHFEKVNGTKKMPILKFSLVNKSGRDLTLYSIRVLSPRQTKIFFASSMEQLEEPKLFQLRTRIPIRALLHEKNNDHEMESPSTHGFLAFAFDAKIPNDIALSHLKIKYTIEEKRGFFRRKKYAFSITVGADGLNWHKH